jgi:hypothetical protein
MSARLQAKLSERHSDNRHGDHCEVSRMAQARLFIRKRSGLVSWLLCFIGGYLLYVPVYSSSSPKNTE